MKNIFINEDWELKVVTLIISIILLLILICTFFWSFFIINPWEVWIKKTLWKVQDWIYENWVNFKKPFIDTIESFNIQTQKLETNTESSTRDLQIVYSLVAINFNFDKNSVKNLYIQVWKEEIVSEKIIKPMISEKIKSWMAMYTSEELITKRSEVSDKIKELLNNSLQSKGINIESVNFLNLDFSESYNQAIEKKVTAEQEALAEKNRLEKIKAEAEQKIVKAEAEAEAIRIQSEAIQKQGWEAYIKLKYIEKWNWQLPTTMAWENQILLLK